jgi:hypothetical protein
MQIHIIQTSRKVALINVAINLNLIELEKNKKFKEYFETLLQVKKRTNDTLALPKLSPAFYSPNYTQKNTDKQLYDISDFSNETTTNIEGHIKYFDKTQITETISKRQNMLNDLKRNNEEEIDAISSNITQLAIQSECEVITSPSPYKGFNKEETQLVQEWMRNEIDDLFVLMPKLKKEASTEDVIDFIQSIKIYRIGDGSSFLSTFTSAMNYELIIQKATTNNSKYGKNGKYDLEELKKNFYDTDDEDTLQNLENEFKINIFVVNEKKRYPTSFIDGFTYPYTLFLWKNSSNNFDIVFAENNFLFKFASNFLKWVVLKQTVSETKNKTEILEKQKYEDIFKSKIIPDINAKKLDDDDELEFFDTNSGPEQSGGAVSMLSYYVIIDLELYPGKDGIPYDKSLLIGCQNKYEEIRHAWADLFKLEYKPLSLYHTSYDKKREDMKKSRYTRRQPANYYKNYKTRRLYS